MADMSHGSCPPSFFFDIPINIKMENDLTLFFFRINLKSMADMSHDIPINIKMENDLTSVFSPNQFKNDSGHEPCHGSI